MQNNARNVLNCNECALQILKPHC